MNKNEMKKQELLREAFGFAPDSRSPAVCGQINGYYVIAHPGGYINVKKNYSDVYWSLCFSVRGEQWPLAQAQLDTLVQSCSSVSACIIENNQAVVCVPFNKDRQTQIFLLRNALESAASFFAQNGFVACCCICGNATATTPAVLKGAYVHLCPNCSWRAFQQTTDEEPKKERVALGLLGALLGSLLGVACIVLLNQLNLVAAISGIAMAVFTLLGYNTFSGTQSKKGIIFCVVLMIVMVYFGNQICWAISAAKYFSTDIFTAFFSVSKLISNGSIDSATYLFALAELYFFALLGAVPSVISAFKAQKLSKISYPIQ